MVKSPYEGLKPDQWQAVTDKLIEEYPLTEKEIVDSVLGSWNDIFQSKIGGLQIGKEIHPAPQIIGFLLHELIPYKLSQLHPGIYKVGTEKHEKDIHCIKDDSFSVEIKTSSHASSIYGNRSYAQQNAEKTKKNKNGYYLTINFVKFSASAKVRPEISIVRFGYIEHTDWRAQRSETGQQASLSLDCYKYKLKVLYDKTKTLPQTMLELNP